MAVLGSLLFLPREPRNGLRGSFLVLLKLIPVERIPLVIRIAAKELSDVLSEVFSPKMIKLPDTVSA